MDWGSVFKTVAVVAAPVVLGAVGNAMLPGVGGMLGAAAGGWIADGIEHGGMRWGGYKAALSSGLTGGGGGAMAARGLGRLAGRFGGRTASGGRHAAAGAAGRTPNPVGQRGSQTGLFDPGRRAGTWNPFNVSNNFRSSGLGTDLTKGAFAAMGYGLSRSGPQQMPKPPDQKQGGGAKGAANAGKFVGGYVESARKGDFPQFTNPDNTKGFLWQPDGLSPGLKTLYSKDTGAAAAVTI
ncbi:hypothetical protein [Nocardia cyriacigeorgica]|uniref:hypothetical protein n=1 Tax=Nocardia cyriacigeorgica TaxID=135487 RepID=UPI0018932222|nr:hypothetical protein [Nocardia cyriacigeorgica]MBF6324896.1 hypothetical protein [Nocardia cyriacigeorgica]MBF6496065.1 hypothetical protein [Nocardia cyriacigeorgica]